MANETRWYAGWSGGPILSEIEVRQGKKMLIVESVRHCIGSGGPMRGSRFYPDDKQLFLLQSAAVQSLMHRAAHWFQAARNDVLKVREYAISKEIDAISKEIDIDRILKIRGVQL